MQLPPSGLCGMSNDNFFIDDEIPPMTFYGNLKKVAKTVTLEEAEAAVSAISESDIEDEEEIENGNRPEPDKTDRNEDEDEDIIPLAELARKLFSKKSKKRIDAVNETWIRKQFLPPNIVYVCPENSSDIDESQTPLTYFSKYFSHSIFSELAEKTNMYSVYQSGKSLNTNESEIKKLVALHIVMGIIRFPRLRMYWTPSTKIKFVNDIGMSRNRFECLRNNLHIVDINAVHEKSDKLWKVRPIISSFENRCEQLQLEENLCIDESIIPFKGQLIVKQYIKGKPNPWGVKVFMLCGASGIIYRSIVYQGSTTLPGDIQEQYAATDGLVIYLSNRIPDHHGHKLFCDNYFTSLLLLRELLQRGIFTAGTIRNNRLKKCPLKLERELQKTGRGSCDSFVTSDNKIIAVRWYDNKVVNMASNFIGIEPEDEVKRWDKKQGEYIVVKRPSVIRLYNRSMGGVDKNDFLIALYRTFIRSRKWTLRVIFHYFNLAVCNAWLEYRRDIVQKGQKSHMDLLQFTMITAESLAFYGFPVNTTKRGRPQSSTSSPRSSPVLKKGNKVHIGPSDDVRYDNIGHYPEHQDGHEQRCKLETCAGRSRIQCEKCQVPLCLSKFKNCFKKFHVK